MAQENNGNNLVVQGRIVWVSGDLFAGKQKKDYNTNQPLINADGSPKVEYGFGLAIPKIDPATGQNHPQYVEVWQALNKEALTLYPNGQIPPNFAMKFKDGDGIDSKGKSFADREGYAGHIVLSCMTQLTIKYFKFEGGNNILVSNGFKCGDYVNVQLNIKAHLGINNGLPGLYVNPSAVQFIQEGAEIINTPSGDQIFGQNVPNYAGQVVPNVAPQMPVQGQPPVQPQMPVQGQAPVAPQMPVQGAAVNPHYPVLPPTMQPQQGMPVQGVVPPAGVTPTQPMQQNAMQTPMGNGYAQPAVPSNGLPQAIPGMPPTQGMPQ